MTTCVDLASVMTKQKHNETDFSALLKWRTAELTKLCASYERPDSWSAGFRKDPVTVLAETNTLSAQAYFIPV